MRFKADLTDHTGSGQHAHFRRIQPKKRDFSSLVGQKIGANLTARQIEQAETILISAVNIGAFRIFSRQSAAPEYVFLLCR